MAEGIERVKETKLFYLFLEELKIQCEYSLISINLMNSDVRFQDINNKNTLFFYSLNNLLDSLSNISQLLNTRVDRKLGKDENKLMTKIKYKLRQFRDLDGYDLIKELNMCTKQIDSRLTLHVVKSKKQEFAYNSIVSHALAGDYDEKEFISSFDSSVSSYMFYDWSKEELKTYNLEKAGVFSTNAFQLACKELNILNNRPKDIDEILEIIFRKAADVNEKNILSGIAISICEDPDENIESEEYQVFLNKHEWFNAAINYLSNLNQIKEMNPEYIN